MDWRPLARRVADGWRVIALTAAVAVLVAAVVTLADSNRYASEAYIAVAKPETELRFDERFAAPEANPAFPYQVNTLRTYGELAQTPALAEIVAQRLEADGMTEATPQALLEQVEVEALADGTLLVVTARADTPEGAARIANVWAESFSEQMAEVFGGATYEHPVFAARVYANEALVESEEALAEFHAVSPLPALEAEVSNLQARQRRLLEASDRLASAERDLTALRQRTSAGDVPDLADQVVALTLQLNALTSGQGAPIDLDFAAGGFDVGVGDAELDGLEALIAASRASLALTLAGAPNELAERTAALERERALLARLQRAKLLAEERFMTLARKSDEMDVARETSRPELRIAAAATEPDGMDISSLARNVLAALLLGVLAGAGLVLLFGARADSEPGQSADKE